MPTYASLISHLLLGLLGSNMSAHMLRWQALWQWCNLWKICYSVCCFKKNFRMLFRFLLPNGICLCLHFPRFHSWQANILVMESFFHSIIYVKHFMLESFFFHHLPGSGSCSFSDWQKFFAPELGKHETHSFIFVMFKWKNHLKLLMIHSFIHWSSSTQKRQKILYEHWWKSCSCSLAEKFSISTHRKGH